MDVALHVVATKETNRVENDSVEIEGLRVKDCCPNAACACQRILSMWRKQDERRGRKPASFSFLLDGEGALRALMPARRVRLSRFRDSWNLDETDRKFSSCLYSSKRIDIAFRAKDMMCHIYYREMLGRRSPFRSWTDASNLPHDSLRTDSYSNVQAARTCKKKKQTKQVILNAELDMVKFLFDLDVLDRSCKTQSFSFEPIGSISPTSDRISTWRIPTSKKDIEPALVSSSIRIQSSNASTASRSFPIHLEDT